MSLTRQQALAAAGLLALAFDAAAIPPGGTISQGAAAAAGGAQGAAGALHKGSGSPKKVATAPGSAFYHKPIGALIIPHGHPHFVKGAPSHEVKGNISEAKWIANQWKGATHAEASAKAKAAAEKAVAEGTHHWVQAGQHTYAVHNGLETHVPKDVDIHDAAAVKNAPKVIVKHGGDHPEHLMLHPDHPAEPEPHGPVSGGKALATGYKKLPDQPSKKAVTFGGKHAAWVPHDWQVHKDTDIPEATAAVKYAKDPAGHWHTISKHGEVKDVPVHSHPVMENWAKSGQLAPDTHPGPEPEHVAPNQGAPAAGDAGHEKPKADIGGVAATKDEIHSAIQWLNEDKSTAVKQPLVKKGHPLAYMDYHGVAAAELAAHPELKIPKGTKKAHVGQVKVAVLHHLAAQAAKLSQDEAQAKAAQEAKAAAEATAVHAQQLSPGTADIGGVTAAQEHIADAVKHLTAAKSTSIKQILKAKGNPLAAADYWKVINDYKAAHPPGALGHGTKQAHVANAKTLFLAALNEHLGSLVPADEQSGHTVAADLHEAVTAGPVKPYWEMSADGAVAKALWLAAAYKAKAYTHLSSVPGEWMTGFMVPPGKAYFEATPEHGVTMHLSDGSSHEWTPEHVADVAKEWSSAGAPEPEKPSLQDLVDKVKKLPPEPPKPEPAAEPAPGPVWDTAAWKQTPEYQTVHTLIANHPPGLPPHDNKLDTNQQLAAVLVLASKFGQKRYLVPGPGGGWVASSHLPAGIAGTFGMPGKAYYEVSKDHEITAFGSDGQPVALSAEQIEQIAQDWLTQPEPPKPAEPDIPISVLGVKVGAVPAGSKVYVHKNATTEPGNAAKFVKLPDGGWKQFVDATGGTATTPASAVGAVQEKDGYVKDGTWIPYPAGQEKPPEPGTVPVTINGKVVYHAPAGTTLFYDATEGAPDSMVYLRAADGTWQVMFPDKAAPTGSATSDEQLDEAVVSGMFKAVDKAGEELAAKLQSAGPGKPAAGIEQLKQLLINGAVKPSAESEGGKGNPDWGLVSVMQKAAKTSHEVWAVKKFHGGWATTSYEPYEVSQGSGAEWFHVTADLAVTNHTGGKDVTVSPEMAEQTAQQLIEPDSVKIDMGGKYAFDYKLFKHGFYYKPSKAAKAYLEISPPQPGATKTVFIYHAPSGIKPVNAAYAAKVLAEATEYHAQPKGAAPSVKKVAYATTFKPVTYQQWSDIAKAPSPDKFVTFHADGSALITGPSSSVPLSAEGDPAAALLKGGVVLDEFGTSVVKPGVVPGKYHILGGAAKTPEELQAALDQMQAAYTDKAAIAQIVSGLGAPDKKLAYAFFNAKLSSVEWHGQRDVFMGLLRELLQVPKNKPGTETEAAGPAEVKFLKDLPPGIATAKDVFTWTEQGYAAPADHVLDPATLPYQNAADLGAAIKAISAQFGDGKVVGTHPSALAKDAKVAWLYAWQAGNMATVFALDAHGGKVSPAHPGAPDNAATHQISWAPWDVSQVPASQPVEGGWTAEGVLPPKAEVDNYVIKAGLQHAAFLTTQQRREWMTAHRAHDQFTVDKLSKYAMAAFLDGTKPKTEPPAWTENLAPAKPWDAYLDEKTAAQQWPADVLTAFADAHQGELWAFLDQAAQQYGSSTFADLTSYYQTYYAAVIKQQAVQAYLDDLAAKEEAEKLKPRYHLGEPGTAEDQFGRQYEWITGTPAQLARRIAVAELARAWGFRTPQITTVKLEDGTAGAVAPLLAHDGTLAGLSYQGYAALKQLTSRQLGDIAREHVLDYALASPGSTPGDYLLLADGSVAGAGKPAALSDLGWDGADLTGMNAAVTQPVSLVFSALSQGWLGQEQADPGYVAAIRAARRMAMLSDDRMSQSLAAAGLAGPVIAQLIERKNSLPDQIAGLWNKVYAQQGWTPPEVPVAKLTHGLHSGFSEPEFTDHVLAAKSFGVPAFFDEPGLADGHVLVWTELDPQGNRLIRGEAAIRQLATDKVTGWVKAHSGDAASMVPKGEVGFSQAIQDAALYIDKHNMVMKNYDYTGPETSKAMTAMADAKAQLTAQLADAQHALTLGPSSSAYQQVAKDYGDPASVVSMAQFYLAQVDLAEQAKAAGVGTPLSPEQFPGWTASEQTHTLSGGVKITYKKATRQLGTDAGDITEHTWSLGKDDGELRLKAGKSAGYPGYVWQVALPTGEVIEINDSAETQTPKAHTGMIRFTAVTQDGAASLERIRAFLQHAGLGMEEATAPGMENLYWRQLGWVLSDRADRKDPKHMKVWDELAQGLYGKPAWQSVGPGKEATHLGDLPSKVTSAGLAPEAEAALWRTAWAHLTSPEQVQQWVGNGGHLPHLGHYDIHAPQVPGGKPDWYRFDVSPEQAAAQQMLTESLYDSTKDALLVARSGGLHSSDARLRALGTYKTGMSWGSDMSHGASGMVFTRQNQQSSSAPSVWISPRVLARSQTYAFPSDHYGEIDDRRTSAFFDFAKASAHSGGTNEALILDSVSLLDDIEVLKAHTEAQRQQIISDLKGAGVTEIRGMAVEDRIVTSAGVSAAVQKAKAALAGKLGSWFAHPDQEGGLAAPAAAAAGAVKSVAKGLAGLVKNAGKNTVSVDHAAGAAAAAVNQVFYKMAGADPQAGSMAVRGKIKGEVAKRIAGAMKSGDGDIQALYDAAGLYAPAAWGPTARIRSVAAVLGSWAVGSDSPVIIALQRRAQQVFGLAKDPYLPPVSASTEAQVQDLESGHAAVLDDLLAAMWQQTQQDLADGGVENVTLYRVFKFSGEMPAWAENLQPGQVIDSAPSYPFSSWSLSPAEIAKDIVWGHGKPVLVKTTVPRSLLLAYPRSGLGSYLQGEFVVLDSAGQWEVVS